MAFDLTPILQQSQVFSLIPEWFYLYSGLVYLLSLAISFLVSYFSFRLYRISSSRKQSLLAVAFLLIGIGFTFLSAASFYTYENSKSLDQSAFDLNNNAYSMYYVLTLAAYLFIVMINLPKKDEKLFLIVPLWFINSSQFHLTALLFLIYISARSVFNFFKVKTEDAFLVMFAFLMITLFHVFLLLMPFGIELYLVAHTFLIVGFLSLLAMLIRVTRK